MMIFNTYLIFTILFITTAVRSDELEITDYSSIQKFISNIWRMESSYKLNNDTISDGEINNITKTIFNDALNLMAEVNKIPRSVWPIPFGAEYLINFFNLLDNYQFAKNHFRWGQFSRKLNTIIDICEDIRWYVESLLRIRDYHFFDDDNLMKYCPIITNGSTAMMFRQRKSIVKEYEEFIKSLWEVTYIENSDNFCGQTWSFTLGIYDLYRQVIISSLHEYILFHYMEILNKRCHDHDTWYLRGPGLTELTQILLHTKKLLADTRHYLHTCDIGELTYGEVSHYELERMIQTVIIKEEDLTTDGSCSHNCNLRYIDTINTTECDEYQNCQYISSSYDICETMSDSRRYSWFNDSNGIVYGNGTGGCDSPLKSVSSELAFFKFRYCDYCVCTCLKKTNDIETISAISFREQVSDIDNDMLVVGVRFIEKNHMIHVQIKEKPINSSNDYYKYSWKELENIQYDETGNIFYNSDNTVLKPGIDYGHPKIVNFDDLIAPRGYVITGVRLRFAAYGDKKPDLEVAAIELQIRVTPFDYNTGKLINLTQTHWIVPEYTSRRELTLTDPDNPLKLPVNVIDSKKDQFIRFRNSDLKKDAGQSTVPFFDAQDVEGSPLYPLGGMGIIHRGHEGYGGFLAFKIYDVNLVDVLKYKVD
ncbi:uncharacterized protein LOC130669777 [Microplitis mediator]|uniref:uncharacterized protein LOC130669777 n=1 Tax=Microplitis mediator TaxID=375433 RepID=UPI002557B44A|nr:uncharacterized protein LOC130669777 [Microplitis mediator]